MGKPVFIEAKDDGSGGDNWSYKLCKVPVKSSPPKNQHPVFTGQMPFLSHNQQCQSTGVLTGSTNRFAAKIMTVFSSYPFSITYCYRLLRFLKLRPLFTFTAKIAISG